MSGFVGRMVLALEPRWMFDGSAVATATEPTDQGTNQDYSADAAQPAPPAVSQPGTERREVAFVDSAVADWQALANGLGAGVEVVVLDGATDGLGQIARWAESNTGYDAIHVLSHGSDGRLSLGTASLDADALTARRIETAAIGRALGEGGDILLYGCDVAKGPAGLDFIGRLASLTGADVAASADRTGAAADGGDWVLETSAGPIEAQAQTIGAFTGTLGAEAVAATGGTLAARDDGVAVTVDSAVTVANNGDNITGARVVIAANKTAGDSLSFTAQHGITGSYDSTKGILTLNGTATAAQWQDVFRSVTYSGSSAGAGDRTITFSLGTGVALGGHYYEAVNNGSSITWTAAKAAAEARTYFGLQGYLTTITSATESAFINEKISSNAWIGASDDNALTGGAEGDFYWVTGPEAGTRFTIGNDTPVADSGRYSNWADGEPNDSGGEDYAHILGNSGMWNDYPNSLNVTVYVVEYGGMGGDPAVTLSASRTVSVASNARPVLDNTASPALSAIAGDIAAPVAGSTANSTLVSSLVATTGIANFSDADGDSPAIAITGVSDQGTLYYSTNGGTTWSEVGSVSNTSARVLHADANTRIYFKPNHNSTATITDVLTFKAWDRTGGSANGAAGVNTTSGTAFSTASDTISVGVAAVVAEQTTPHSPPPPAADAPPPPAPPSVPPPTISDPVIVKGDGHGGDTSGMPIVAAVRNGPAGSDAKAAGMVTAVRETQSGGRDTAIPTATRGGGDTAGGDGGRGTSVGAPGVALAPILTRSAPGGFTVAVVAEAARTGNEAIIMARPIGEVIQTGRVAFQVPADAFAHTSADAVVTLRAAQAGGQPLPSWLSFNPESGAFEGAPPPGSDGVVEVKVTARDADGREAVQVFKITVAKPTAAVEGRPSLTAQLKSAKTGALARHARTVETMRLAGRV